MKKLSILLLLLTTSSCSHIGPLLGKKNNKPKKSIAELTSKSTYENVKIDTNTSKSHKVVKTTDPKDEDRTFLEKIFPKAVKGEDKNSLNLRYKDKHYNFWKKYFSKREKARFERHMSNGLKFEKIVKSVLKEHNLPTDLFYVGLIESGYNTHIRSSASAVGPWQFIKGTGTRYGLKVDRYLDERRNIYKASHAAANYFKDLYNIFGSWELALCGYNAGEYGIIRSIRKGNTRDYRELVRKKLIPRETINYVPKVAAAKYLYENRKKYGLKPKTPNSSIYLDVDEVEARKSFSLSKVARSLNISMKKMRILNPEVKKDWVAVTRRHPFKLLLPKGYEKKFASLNFSKRRRVAKREVTQSISRSVSSIYRVKRGDNLTEISKKFGLPVRRIKRANKLRSSKIMVGQRLSIPGTSNSIYRVKRGDNLSGIARKLGLSVSKIKSANNLRSSKIMIGQRLSIPTTISRYRVRGGDNLSGIARKFNTSIKQIVVANNLRGHRIYKGQHLIIPSES